MKFIHITDFHLVAEGELLWGLDPSKRLDAALADIVTYHADAAFVAITGDLSENGKVVEYELLTRKLATFPFETHVILGNHDDRDNFKSVFSDHPLDGAGFVQHGFEADGKVFLFLDTLKGPPSSAGKYSDERKIWLTEELAKAGGKPVYLFMHHPPFSIAHDLMDRIMLDDAEDFAAMLKGHDIRHIFFGHGHRAVSGNWRGIGFSSLPGMNHQLPLVAASVDTSYSVEPPAYGVVHLVGDGIIVHNDAFLDRKPAAVPADAYLGDWS